MLYASVNSKGTLKKTFLFFLIFFFVFSFDISIQSTVAGTMKANTGDALHGVSLNLKSTLITRSTDDEVKYSKLWPDL